MVPLAARAHKTRGKSRNKNHKPEVEQLRDEVRTLKSTIRHLKKELNQAMKGQYRLENLEEMISTQDSEAKSDSAGCPDCGKGTINLVELGPKSMLVCNVCSYWRLVK